MSKYDKASLVHIPSGYKSGTLYNVLPNNADGDFDFSRGSTATRVNKDGLIETVASGVPRLDYPLLDGVVQDNPTLLLEPSRQNVLIYSEDISNSVWTAISSGQTVVSNSVVSPDGSQNADTLEGDGTNVNVFIRQDVSLNTSTDYTFSVFAKKGTNNFLAIATGGFTGSTNTLVFFDLENSIVTSGVGSIEDYGNGWLRCIFTTSISTDGTGRFLLYPAYNGTTRAFPSASDADGQNIYLWGAQLEQGSYPTSYIKTQGATVTRSADICNGAEADFNDSEGVLYANIAALTSSEGSRDIEISDGNDDRVIIQYNPSGGIQVFVIVGGTTTYTYGHIATITQFKKISLKYKENDFALWVDGFKVDSSNSGSVFSANTLTQLDFLKAVSQNLNFYGKTKEVIVFNEALSDTELENLTSWDSFREMATEQGYSVY